MGDSPSNTPATEGLPASNSLLCGQVRVAVTAGPDAGKQTVSDGELLVIGTHERCGFRLSDSAVSRFHCQLEFCGDRLILRDLGSRNGTNIGSLSVLEAEVGERLELRIGRSSLRIDRSKSSLRLPLSDSTRFGPLVGESAPMRRLFSILERVAPGDTTVLIGGETGTGKEVVARAIHDNSSRASGPFVVVDCGAISSNLIEAELFGHLRGAFTGADRDRSGAFEAACGGTLFLDEIGELPIDLQPKLLRALESRTIQRVGSNEQTPIDTRIVAATHRNLRLDVNRKRFRSDLYYRLAVLEVVIPPLRERPEDIPLLVEELLDRIGVGDAARARVQSDEFLTNLKLHSWPGNVRELRNRIERDVVLAELADLSAVQGEGTGSSVPAIDLNQPLRVGRELWIRYFERNYLEGLLGLHGGNVTEAARAAGIDRSHFYRLLDRSDSGTK